MGEDRPLQDQQGFKLKDRKESPLVLAMTHEEAVTNHVAHECARTATCR